MAYFVYLYALQKLNLVSLIRKSIKFHMEQLHLTML